MLSHQKHLFSLPDDITYLNGAYMGPQLKSVEAVGIENLKRKNHPFAITPEDFFTERKILKERFAQLIEARDYQNIAIVPSVSYGIANAANNVSLKKEDEIVLVDEQFPSNVYIWKRLAEAKGATIKVITPPADFVDRGKRWNDFILDAINSKTAVVSMPQVHWADGTLFDLKAIREKTKSVNAMLIIDGTQSVGAFPFSVSEIEPDALVCGGYKWLLGPYSLGVAYYSDAFNDGLPIEDNWMNRLHSEDFNNLVNYQDQFQAKAGRYSVGESSNFVLTPMLIRSIEQLLEWKPENIQSYCQAIAGEALQHIKEKGCFIEEEKYRSHHLFGIYLPDHLDIDVIKQRLIDNKVFVSYRGKAIRISVNVYNTKEDLAKLVNCIR